MAPAAWRLTAATTALVVALARLPPAAAIYFRNVNLTSLGARNDFMLNITLNYTTGELCAPRGRVAAATP